MSIVDKVKGMLGQHSDKSKEAVDKAGDMVDQRTGGKYSDKVDKAQDKAREYIDKDDQGSGGQPA
jgi:MT0933-like antitoxin protein